MESLTESGPEPIKSPAIALVFERLRAIGTLYPLLMLSTGGLKQTWTFWKTNASMIIWIEKDLI